MNIQRFTAATSREALAQARAAFGDDTLILSNRPTDNGVEVVATTEDALASLDRAQAQSTPRNIGANASRAATPLSYKETASKVEDDAAQLAMSTLSFQDYVRERMAKKRQESQEKANRAPRELTQDRPVIVGPDRDDAPSERAMPMPMAAAPRRPAAPAPQLSAPASSHAASHSSNNAIPKGIATELQAMKEMIEDRFNTLSWLGQARQNPVQSNLMLRLIRAGYSPVLSRTILERMPEQQDPKQSMQWVQDVLERNVHTDAQSPALHEEGGIFALIGATGVGKTTTAAKLAGLCARRYGPGSVGLITLDSYRVGAQEQLRAYGKMLGIVAHLAHDRAALQDLLGLLANKKMVLIDTTGVAPRDPRKREVLDMLALPDVQRLLVLNAGSHGDTLEDTVAHFKSGNGQQAILSKIDEAVKLGPAIDATIRHQLLLRGVTTGQRVPEDWEGASAQKLVRTSLQNAAQSPYDANASDLGFIFSQSSSAALGGGALNA